MKLSQFKKHLSNVDQLTFIQSNGQPVPSHFHITEAGKSTKEFIDCGGTLRKEVSTTLQLWVALDFEHRLSPAKLSSILAIYEKHFGGEDLEVEVEFQQDTVGRYDVSFADGRFHLDRKHTDCLAKDHCGIPVEKLKVNLASLTEACCQPGSGCC